MRKTWMAALVMVLGTGGALAQTPSAPKKPAADVPKAADTATASEKTTGSLPADLTTDDAKAVYALGLSVGKDLTVFSLSPEELKILQRGIIDGVGGNTHVDLQEYAQKIQALARGRQGRANAAALERAAKEPGATKLPSGVIYRELKAGTGKSPRATDTVKVHYRGTLLDGTEFDSSYKRSAAVEFPLNGVIPCWTQGVQRMKVGGKAKLTCPGDTAYGAQPPPGSRIPPNAVLVFEVELVDIPGDTSKTP